jgi:hypothetical protein
MSVTQDQVRLRRTKPTTSPRMDWLPTAGRGRHRHTLTALGEHLGVLPKPRTLTGWSAQQASERKVVRMSGMAVVSRYWPPAVLGAVSTAALTFAINFLTDGKPGWWWIVLVAGCLGMAGAAVWSYVLQHDGGGDTLASASQQVAQQDAGVAQQSATGSGTNVAINADNNSAVAWEMGTVNLGREPHNPTSQT